LLGGAGDDFIDTKGGAQDYLECGSGNDVASVDLSDRVARRAARSVVRAASGAPTRCNSCMF
jgi:Ca2+-binding RTX toxin-like protein